MGKTLNTRVAIIGAGCAGLAAAAKLAEQNIPVTIFEAATQLGGRARKVPYQGLELDNGQHILLGAYQETLALLKLVGVDFEQTLQRLPLTMHMYDVLKNTKLTLKTCQYLPAPLHLLAGLIGAKGLSAKDKWLAIRMIATLQISQFKLKQDIDLQTLLTQHKQSKNLIQNLWEPLCLAALNTPLNIASSQVFLNVLRDSFARKKTDSDMLLAKVDLTSLIGEPVSRYIQTRRGEICHAAVDKISSNQHGYTLSTKLSEREFSHVIIAVAPHQLDKIMPNALSDLAMAFNYQPITTIYLQYPTDKRLPLAMQGMVNSISQWVFDRGQICEQHGLMAVVVSAHGAHSQMTQAELAQAVIKEMTLAFKLEQPLWFKIITEKRATFSCEVGLKRPSNTTTLPNLYLAGDYTEGDYPESDYPATIEGAVRSGVKCAALINKQLQHA